MKCELKMKLQFFLLVVLISVVNTRKKPGKKVVTFKKYVVFEGLEEKLKRIENDVKAFSNKRSLERNDAEQIEETEIVVLPHSEKNKHIHKRHRKHHTDVSGSKRKDILHPSTQKEDEELVVVVYNHPKTFEKELTESAKRRHIIHDDLKISNSSGGDEIDNIKSLNSDDGDASRRSLLSTDDKVQPEIMNDELNTEAKDSGNKKITSLNQVFSFSSDDDVEAVKMHSSMAEANTNYEREENLESKKNMKMSEHVLNFVTKDKKNPASLLGNSKPISKQNHSTGPVSYINTSHTAPPESNLLINPKPTTSSYVILSKAEEGATKWNTSLNLTAPTVEIHTHQNMSLPSNKTKHKLNNIEIVTDYITAINKEAKNYKNSRQKGNRDTNNSKSNSYIHALSMETNKSKEVTSSKLEKNNHEVKKMKRKRKKGRKNVVIQNKANDMKSGRLENNTMTTASSEINKSEAKQTEKEKEPLENIGFVKDNFRKRKQHKQLHTNGFLGASKLDRNNHRVNKDAEHRFNSSSKFTEPKRKHHRRESSDDANRMEISEQNDISRYKNGQIGRRVMRVENPIDVAKDIAGFGVNDYRYGESWFEGQNKPIARKRYHGNKEQPTTIDEDGNKASRGSAKNFHGFEQEEEGSSHVRDQPSQIKATGDEIQKAGQFVEDEQINSLVEQKTSNIMKKICHNAVCRNKDGSSDVDGGDDDLSNYVHGGDEIIAKVSIGGEGKGLPKQDIQRISKELAKISRQPIHVIGGLKLLHGIPKNVSATPEELREITGDERDMKNKCACDVSFASVMKIPGCMEYCKTTLQENSVYAKATHVITQMENNGHPLLYDRTSGDLIPHNPLLEAKTGLPSGKSLLPSNKMVGKLQLDKKVLEHVKNDIKHDPGISDVLKEHLKKVADSITKAKIEKILEAPVGKAFGRNFHQNYNDTDESDRSEGFSLQGGEEDSSDMTPIHIRADAAPELIAKLLHQTPHHHPHHHHHNRHFHHHHGDADELEGIDGDALNGIMHHSSSVEDEHDEHDSPKLQELTEPNVIHRLLHHHGIVDDDDGTSDENEQNEVEDGDDEKAVISKGTLLKLLHQSNDETDYDHSSRHHHHGNSLVTEEDDDDENDEKEEFVEDSDPDEHMMFHDKEDDDEKHGRHTHHHVMYPEPIHFKLHHDIVHQNVSAFRQSPCKNGGIYIPHHHRKAECVCPHQYYGKNCKDWNFCYPNPCHNGGQCMLISEIPYHKCICPKAYIGDTCKDFNPCDPSPCNNQGSCSHDGKVATCTCNPRFKGENCAELNNCFPNPCKNSGACVDSNGRFKCLCKEGYIGSTCEGVSYCYSNKPCENGGSCLENGTSYSCLCHKGFVGPTCKDKICSPNPCQNGGTCMQKENSAFACLCPPWATGDTCSDISPCRMNPCKNGARCIDAMSGFRWTLKPMQYFCDCLPPFQGAHCEKNPCSDCGHNAHCDIDHCVCNSGYYGNGLVCRRID